MPAALVLVDMQQDYLDLAGLDPHPAAICSMVATLLSEFRRDHLPVIHVWTTIREHDARMPHWQAADCERCVAGTAGHRTPEILQPQDGEPVVHKQFYSAFHTDELLPQLRASRVDEVVLAGVLLRACIRTTALDAYQHGLSVIIAEDAVGDNDPVHAAITRQYLSARSIRCMTVESICREVVNERVESLCPDRAPNADVPAAKIGGADIRCAASESLPLLSPRDGSTELLSVCICDENTVGNAAASSREALADWQHEPISERRKLLLRSAETLEQQSEGFAHQISQDTGKPIRDAKAEVRFGIELMRAAVEHSNSHDESLRGDQWRAVRRPHGVVAVITPWNNPFAIALGKIVPALLYGNTVVWKPAVPGAAVAAKVINSICDGPVPAAVVNLVNGGRSTAEQLISQGAVDAVAFTGSTRAGTSAEVLAATRKIPFQAELGGNNAAIVWSDADLAQAAELIAAGGFGSAGQRCTATRRVIVHEKCFDKFFELLQAAVRRLQWGDPFDDATHIGPVISAQAFARLDAIVARFADSGGRVVRPCDAPSIVEACRHGYYFPPTIAVVQDCRAEIEICETFGPIVVVQRAESFAQAMDACNHVPQGLVASLFSESAELLERFVECVDAGILKVNVPTAGVSADAPFCGWKSSGVGPPEHSVGDREFYTRWQVVYGEP